MLKATVVQIMNYFEMNRTEFIHEWKKLDDAEKDYFKTAVGEVVHQ